MTPLTPNPDNRRLLGARPILACRHCGDPIPTSRDWWEDRADLCRTCDAAAEMVFRRETARTLAPLRLLRAVPPSPPVRPHA